MYKLKARTHMSENTECLHFWVWLILFRMIISESVHFFYIFYNLIFPYHWIKFHCVRVPHFFIQSSVDEWAGLHFLATGNRTTVKWEHTLKSFCMAGESTSGASAQPEERLKVFASHTSDRDFISWVYKELQTLRTWRNKTVSQY